MSEALRLIQTFSQSLLWRIGIWRVVIVANDYLASRYCGE